jgi:hypothetical protein
MEVVKFREFDHVGELVRLLLPQLLQLGDGVCTVDIRLGPLAAACVPVGLSRSLVLHVNSIPIDDLSKPTLA